MFSFYYPIVFDIFINANISHRRASTSVALTCTVAFFIGLELWQFFKRISIKSSPQNMVQYITHRRASIHPLKSDSHRFQIVGEWLMTAVTCRIIPLPLLRQWRVVAMDSWNEEICIFYATIARQARKDPFPSDPLPLSPEAGDYNAGEPWITESLYLNA